VNLGYTQVIMLEGRYKMVRITDPLIIALYLLLSQGVHATPQDNLPHIRVCGDAIDWPPYTYVQDNEVQGYDVDVLNRALTDQGVSYDLTMTSWSRCLRGAKNGEFDLAMSSSYNSQRDVDYLYTDWYYTITPHYVYSTKQFPDGLNISNVQDLKRYKLCGNHGYNYDDFTLDSIKRVGNSINDVLQKVRQGECDVYLSWEEILEGNKTVWGIQHIYPPLVSIAVPNMEPHRFYMLISRQLAEKSQLKSLLDDQLKHLREELN